MKYPECSRELPIIAVPIWVSVGDESFKAFIDTLRKQTTVG